MKILALKISHNNFTFYEDFMDPLSILVMYMGNFVNCVTVYEFEETFDPSYLNLDKDDPDAWKVYAEKVRFLMSEALQVPRIPLSYRNGVLEF